jgi:hypothetical protein
VAAYRLERRLHCLSSWNAKKTGEEVAASVLGASLLWR